MGEKSRLRFDKLFKEFLEDKKEKPNQPNLEVLAEEFPSVKDALEEEFGTEELPLEDDKRRDRLF